jgi:glycine cleavage system H protein
MAETRYTQSHEWCRLDGDVATVGITKHAVDELGDLTFLDYRAEAGADVAKGDVFGEIDSVKATSELYAPLAGSVVEVNERFKDEDALSGLSEDPEGEGWLIKIKVSDAGEHAGLMDLEAYQKHCAEG